MKKCAYFARQNAGSDPNVPSGWPYGWQYPDDNNDTPYPQGPLVGGQFPEILWPPGWPVPRADGTVIVVDSPAQLSISGNGVGAVEVYATVGGDEADASVYANHLLLITATYNGLDVPCQGPNDAGMGAGAVVKVTNYNGNRWGWSGNIDFDLSGLDPAIDLVVRAELVTAVAVVSGTDTTDLIS